MTLNITLSRNETVNLPLLMVLVLGGFGGFGGFSCLQCISISICSASVLAWVCKSVTVYGANSSNENKHESRLGFSSKHPHLAFYLTVARRPSVEDLIIANKAQKDVPFGALLNYLNLDLLHQFETSKIISKAAWFDIHDTRPTGTLYYLKCQIDAGQSILTIQIPMDRNTWAAEMR